MRYRAHTENVVVQSIQNEVVLVNLESGIYYALNGSAAVIFSALDSGCSQDELINYISNLYAENAEPLKADIDQFVNQLLDESLLVAGSGTTCLDPKKFVQAPIMAPVLNKFEDLQELLLLDPVRDLPVSAKCQSNNS